MSIPPSSSAQPSARPVRVWDFPTRAFHWMLAVLVGFSWYSGNRAGSWLEWHFWSGYAVLALLLFRVAWGFVGGAWARFSSFVRGPGAAFHHIQDLFSPRDMRDIGHNPIGGWMVIVILLILFVMAAHVLAVVIYLIWKGENLIGAMITGRKTLDAELSAQAERVKADGNVWLALAILAAALGVVFAIVKLA